MSQNVKRKFTEEFKQGLGRCTANLF